MYDIYININCTKLVVIATVTLINLIDSVYSMYFFHCLTHFLKHLFTTDNNDKYYYL